MDLPINGWVSSYWRFFESRSGNSPLSVRIIEPPDLDYILGVGKNSETYHFMSDVGSRMESFELAWFPPVVAGDYPTCLDWLPLALGCASGKLTRLVITDRIIHSGFSLSAMELDSPIHWLLGNSSEYVIHEVSDGSAITVTANMTLAEKYEDIFAHVKVLMLDLVYPFWTSKAYHGLTELHLTGPRKPTALITTQQLARILESSPELRVLQFGLEVSPSPAPPPPVCLDYLEVFSLQSLRYDTQQVVLRLILPGQKPLEMSTTYNLAKQRHLPGLVEDEFYRFFKRSNIVRLQIHSPGMLGRLANLSEVLPGLQIVVLVHSEVVIGENLTTLLGSRLHTVHFISCRIHLDALQWLVSTHNLKSVVVGNCNYIRDRKQMTREELVEICPAVKFSDDGYYHGGNQVVFEGWAVEDMLDRLKMRNVI